MVMAFAELRRTNPFSHAGEHFLVLPRLRTFSYIPFPHVCAHSRTIPPVSPSLPMVESETCACGRSFSHTFAFTNHQRTCQKTKKRLSDALSKARVLWVAKKKPRLDVSRKTVEPLTNLGDENTGESSGAAEVLCSGPHFPCIANLLL